MPAKDMVRQAANVLAAIATVAMGWLANALPLNGQTTGQISDRFQVYFVPADYAFSIWSLIYLGLIAFAIYQALPAQRENVRLRRLGYLFVLSSLANIAWLFFWHYELFPLTVVAMVILLVLLIASYLRLDIGRVKLPATEKWLVDVPFSLYLGWITVATIANITILLDYWNWAGWGLSQQVWAVILLVVSWLIASAVSLTRGDAAYVLVILWAFIGIAVRNAGVPLVGTAAWLMAALVVVMLIAGLLLDRRRGRAGNCGC